jgi:hypothetical protein
MHEEPKQLTLPGFPEQQEPATPPEPTEPPPSVEDADEKDCPMGCPPLYCPHRRKT